MKNSTKAVFRTALMAGLCLAGTITSLSAEEPWKITDARDLRVINRGWPDGQHPYRRLPDFLQDSIRPNLGEQAKSSAGVAVRFATNSSRIGARYQLLYDGHMNHMADTGIKGADLYIFEGDSVWRHVNTVRPYLQDAENKIVDADIISNLDTTKMTEYMIYFPLYDGVEKFEVKVDPEARLNAGSEKLIDKNLRVVTYGTSIMQGGCASRPGMASSNIISRELNAEVINLGFSGEGKMDYCVARAMAQIPDVSLFILDPVPNCDREMCDTLTSGFINIIRAANPEVPILMVEGPIFPFARYNPAEGEFLRSKNAAFRRNYEELRAAGDNNLYFVDSVNLDGIEDDGTVDGIHLTDLGFRHYADKVMPVIRQILKND